MAPTCMFYNTRHIRWTSNDFFHLENTLILEDKTPARHESEALTPSSTKEMIKGLL